MQEEKDDFQNPGIRNKDIWSDISSEMQAQGHVTCDAKSCETKFKNLIFKRDMDPAKQDRNRRFYFEKFSKEQI